MRVTPSGQNVVVSWQGGNGPYQLLCRTNLNAEWRKVGSPTSGYIVTNPSMSTPACFYRITTDLTAPLTPGGLTITTNTDPTQLVLRWNAVTDNSGGAGMKGYNIYRNNLFIKRVLPTATTTIDTGLTPDTAYTYTVSAEDLVANESAKSTSVSGRTPRRNCSYGLSLASAYPGAAASSGAFTVTTGSSCSWSPVSSAPSWLTCSPSSGTGSGTVAWYVTANTSTSSRSGTLTIGGQTFSVTQAGATLPCTYTLSSSSAYPASGPGSGTFTVTVGTTCSWSPSSSDPSWLTCSPSSGAGGGTVTWYVTANTSTSSRYATLTIGGQTFSVTQAGAPLPCTYALSSSSAYPAATSGSGAFSVTAGATCSWSPSSSDASWLTCSPSSGVGNGTVTWYVTANTSTSSRYATLTIAGQTFSVTQAGAAPTCTYALSPSSASPGSAAGSGTLNVTAGSACPWTPSSSDPSWLTCSPPSGTGNGTVTWSVTANPSTSSRTATLNISGQYFTVTQAGSTPTGTGGRVQWVKTIQNTSPCGAGSAGIASDSFGNTVVVGKFNGTMDLGRGAVTSVGSASDIFITKYNPQGTPLWVKTIGNTGADSASGVAIDRQDNIIVVGSFSGVVDFGGGPLISAGGTDIFVAKYTNSGANPPTLLWAKRFGGTWADGAKAVAVGPNNDVFVAAWFMSVNGDFGSFTLSALGSQDIALARLDQTDGHPLWARSYGGTQSEQPTAITVDNSGNVWVGGQFYVVTDLGTGPKANADPSGNTTDMFLARYSGTDGRCLYARTMGGAFNDNLGGIAHDPTTDNIIIAGGVSPATDLGGGAINSGLGVAAFVAGYGSAGNYLWARTWGGLDSFAQDNASAVAVDRDGSLAVTGRTSSWMDFGDGPLPGEGYTTVSFTVTGNSPPVYRWAKRASYIDSAANALVFDGLGHVVTAGGMMGIITLDGINYGIGTAYGGAFVAQHMK